ncbi:MAG: ComEC/Rec2 family competence protein [Prevotella sp.]|nr:ComEC/Rec2 family competence protein [Prevotella sp.]
MRLAPLFPVCIALCAGIALAYELSLPFGPCLGVMVVLLILALLIHRWQRVQSLVILLAVLAFGATVMAHHLDAERVDLPEGDIVYQGVITSEPQQRGRVVRFDLQLVGGRLNGRKVKVSLLRDTVAHRYQRLALGDGFLARATLISPYDSESATQKFSFSHREATIQHSTFNTQHFSYPLFLRCRGFVATSFVYWNQWRKVAIDLSPLSRLDRTALAALQQRQSMLREYEHLGFDDDRLAVAIAMTLGDKSRLTNDLREVYSISGASHVLALSGLHIGIIYALLVLVVGYRRLGWLRETLVILGIWAYAFFTGLSPSVVRAAVMITVYSLVALANRDRMSLNTLALTAIIMLLWNPLYLYDVGFQMSFLAVLFILLFFKPIYALIPERWLHPSPDTHHSTLITQHSTLNTRHFFRWSWAMVVVSLCAQMGTFPLTMYYFGRFSVYFLLTNFLVIPLAICILYLTAAMLLLSWWPAAQSLVAQPLIWVVDFQNTALRWIASLPASHIENITLSRLHVILIYAALFILLFLFSRYRNKRVTKELR